MLVTVPRCTAAHKSTATVNVIYKHLRAPQWSKTFYSRKRATVSSCETSSLLSTISSGLNSSVANYYHQLPLSTDCKDNVIDLNSSKNLHLNLPMTLNAADKNVDIAPSPQHSRQSKQQPQPQPPKPKSNYHTRITRHAMESKYLLNLINYKPRFFQNQNRFSVWHKVPVCRRSAVMVLLFLGNEGELRVILTKRSRKLKNFSGHISLPGGKSENGLESEFQCARRETEEEIGISRHNNILKNNFGFTLDELKTLPSYLARTFLAVAPCVGYINWCEDVKTTERRISNLVLNPGESASIFSVPLRDFLQPISTENSDLRECLKQSHIKTKWAGFPWDLRSFIFPLYNKNEIDWLEEVEDLSSPSEDETHEDQELDVRTRNCWGLTANILHDVAEIVYNGTHSNDVIGEEDLIWSLHNHGQVHTRQRTEFEKRLINNTKGSLFTEVIPKEEFDNLKKLYK